MKLFRLVIAVFTSFYFFQLAQQSFAYVNNQSADLVIGQPNFTTVSATVDNKTFKEPQGAMIVNNKLIVADQANNRVLIFNQLPTTNYPAADVVIGQPDFTHNTYNRGGTVQANTLDNPSAIASDGTKLIVSDSNNGRVLIYNTIPTSVNASANVVIGKTGLDTLDVPSNHPKDRIDYPKGVHYDPDSGKLFVANADDHTILIYNSIPTSNGARADVILGGYSGTTDATTLYNPINVRVVNGKLIVADHFEGRVLIWNTIPTTDYAPADIVLGRESLTDIDMDEPTEKDFETPQDVHFDGQRFFVAEEPRVLIYNNLPTTNYAPADKVLGQPDLLSYDYYGVDGGYATYDKGFSFARCIIGQDDYIFVCDSLNNRILRFTNTASINATMLTSLLDSDIFQAQSNTDTDKVTVAQDITITASGSGATNEIELTEGTEITSTDGSNINPSLLQATIPSITQLSNIGTTAQGVLQWGIPNVGLQFSQPVTLRIFVGTNLNGQSLQLLRSVSGNSAWTSDGIISPGICIVAGGYCEFQATKASYYIAGTIINSGNTNSSAYNYSCPDAKPVGIPDPFQINIKKDSAQLFFTPVNTNTSYYMISYGLTEGDERFGVIVPHDFSSGVVNYTVNHLQPNTTYYFKMRAGNGCQPGDWSTYTKAKTGKNEVVKKVYKYSKRQTLKGILGN